MIFYNFDRPAADCIVGESKVKTRFPLMEAIKDPASLLRLYLPEGLVVYLPQNPSDFRYLHYEALRNYPDLGIKELFLKLPKVKRQLFFCVPKPTRSCIEDGIMEKIFDMNKGIGLFNIRKLNVAIDIHEYEWTYLRVEPVNYLLAAYPIIEKLGVLCIDLAYQTMCNCAFYQDVARLRESVNRSINTLTGGIAPLVAKAAEENPFHFFITVEDIGTDVEDIKDSLVDTSLLYLQKLSNGKRNKKLVGLYYPDLNEKLILETSSIVNTYGTVEKFNKRAKEYLLQIAPEGSYLVSDN
jgi:hypothetical protein